MMAKVGFCRAGYGPEDLRLLFPGHAAPGVADREPVRRPPRLGVREQLDLELDEPGGPRVLARVGHEVLQHLLQVAPGALHTVTMCTRQDLWHGGKRILHGLDHLLTDGAKRELDRFELHLTRFEFRKVRDVIYERLAVQHAGAGGFAEVVGNGLARNLVPGEDDRRLHHLQVRAKLAEL